MQAAVRKIFRQFLFVHSWRRQWIHVAEPAKFGHEIKTGITKLSTFYHGHPEGQQPQGTYISS